MLCCCAEYGLGMLIKVQAGVKIYTAESQGPVSDQSDSGQATLADATLQIPIRLEHAAVGDRNLVARTKKKIYANNGAIK